MPLPRSYLYIPGHRADFLAKAHTRGADALIVDLEDAVPASAKEESRATVRQWLCAMVDAPRIEIWIRTNPVPMAIEDLKALADAPHITGFCLAKTECSGDVRTVATALGEAGSTALIMPLLESAKAVHAVRDIASTPQVSRLQLGEADLAVDVGIDPDAYATELLWAHSATVFASASAGIAPPVAAVHTNFRDLGLFQSSTEAMRRRGFFGRACIHPAQVPVVNDVFTVSSDQAEWAYGVLAAHERHGAAAFIGPDGRMVDEAVLRAARRIVTQVRD